MLRNLTIFCLIAAYGVLGLRSLVPTLSYELNYTYFSQEACVYKALPICCQGACQLKKMAKQTEDGESQTGQQLPTETERSTTLAHLEATILSADWQPQALAGAYAAPYCERLLAHATTVDTPPPRT